jgi:hypothetical protein
MKFTLVHSKKTYATAANASRAAELEGYVTDEAPHQLPSGRFAFFKKVRC